LIWGTLSADVNLIKNFIFCFMEWIKIEYAFLVALSFLIYNEMNDNQSLPK